MLKVSMLYFLLNDPQQTEIYHLYLHDALPIYRMAKGKKKYSGTVSAAKMLAKASSTANRPPQVRSEKRGITGYSTLLTISRSEEHTSELQSRLHLVCRLLLEKKKNVHDLYLIF